MVWQRSGTVSVQNGSTTVVGANVDFAAGSRNGDSFIGPDGLTYEVANVASSTVISILPAYKGATVSGAGYAIMPVQGYDKMLSDAFNNLNNQFGPKLAALGTTGNYDILPLQKGGTGANDKAGAQTALEIPTADTPLAIGRGGTGNKLGAATKLATPRNINGVPFDATTDISIPVAFTKFYQSSATSYTNGGLLVFAHGLAAMPKFVQVFFTPTPSDQSGWTAGIALQVASGSFTLGIDPVNVYVQIASDGLFLRGAGAGGQIAMSASAFKCTAKASL